MKVANFDALASINDPVVQRFVNKIDATQGCWIWIGSLDTAGYGCFRFNGKTTLAHRVMWRLVYDQWPTGVLDHKCINPPCVNPAHLDDVSIAENNLRAIAAGLRKKTHCINGHELTPENTGRYKKQGANYPPGGVPGRTRHLHRRVAYRAPGDVGGGPRLVRDRGGVGPRFGERGAGATVAPHPHHLPARGGTVTETHVYGLIEDDWGHHIGYGCTWDAESWPCRAWTRQEQPRG